MIINGLQKLTLLDYPEKTAATVFLAGCNFRCPFCHNSDLVIPQKETNEIEEEVFFNFLSKRKGLLDGVCITGGEPTLRKGLITFAKKIKDMGFLVKLDTNGANPKILKEMIDAKVIDYVAMDIKNSKQKYAITAGVPESRRDEIVSNVNKSIEILKDSKIEYELRTTAVKELHNKEDFIEIGKWIHGAKRYFIQNFIDSGRVIEDGFSGFKKEELEIFKELVNNDANLVEIRGV